MRPQEQPSPEVVREPSTHRYVSESEVRSCTDPGQVSSERLVIVIPEVQSLIFTDYFPDSLPPSTNKRKRRKKPKVAIPIVLEGQHQPLPPDAQPKKSILKKRNRPVT